MPKVFVAKCDLYVHTLGIVVRAGETVREGHPILKGHEQLFAEHPEPDRVDHDTIAPKPYVIPSSTEKPAEKRGPGRPRKNA